MSNVTQMLAAIEAGDQQAGADLLPLIYDQLRRIASQKLAGQPTGQTLQATALVHEAYLRLVDVDDPQGWNSRGHFYVAAAEAMRRIIVESIRRKQSLKRGGGVHRDDIDVAQLPLPEAPEKILALNAALGELCESDPETARLVDLRYFAGLTIENTAKVLGIAPRTCVRRWEYARAWLHREISRQTSPED